jgi:hypothetical protein
VADWKNNQSRFKLEEDPKVIRTTDLRPAIWWISPDDKSKQSYVRLTAKMDPSCWRSTVHFRRKTCHFPKERTRINCCNLEIVLLSNKIFDRILYTSWFELPSERIENQQAELRNGPKSLAHRFHRSSTFRVNFIPSCSVQNQANPGRHIDDNFWISSI